MRVPEMHIESRAARTKRVRFTPAVIESKAPKVGRIERRDDLSPLWLRVTATGDRSFSVRVRIKGQGQPVRLTYPERAHVCNLSVAREWAVKTDGQCRNGTDPRAERRALEAAQGAHQMVAEQTAFEKVAHAYLATNGEFKKNSRPWRPRTYGDYARTVNKRLVPQWKGRSIHSITRDEITDYLTAAAETAPISANRDLVMLTGIMAWYARQRSSTFTSPIVRGMTPSEEKPRDRILADDEIRVVWHIAGKTKVYGGIVRAILLTAARRGEIAVMRPAQIGQDGIWALPGELTKNHAPLYLPLSADARSAIGAHAPDDDQALIFSVGEGRELTSWGHYKENFDQRVLRRLRAIARARGDDPTQVAPLPNWTLHDLRRTARSLMARAKVRPDHAERVLNHKIKGVEGTYDRHSYEDEKRDALDRLARLLRQIVDGEAAKVVRFPVRAVQ
jgi:hypothetical protein